MAHVKGHYPHELQVGPSTPSPAPETTIRGASPDKDEASVSTSAKGSQAPFRCGHCNQVSNWKHVIQVLTPLSNKLTDACFGPRCMCAYRAAAEDNASIWLCFACGGVFENVGCVVDECCIFSSACCSCVILLVCPFWIRHCFRACCVCNTLTRD